MSTGTLVNLGGASRGGKKGKIIIMSSYAPEANLIHQKSAVVAITAATINCSLQVMLPSQSLPVQAAITQRRHNEGLKLEWTWGFLIWIMESC